MERDIQECDENHIERCGQCDKAPAADDGNGRCADCFDPTDAELDAYNGTSSDEPFNQAERDDVASRDGVRR